MFDLNIEELKNTLLNWLYEQFHSALELYLPKLIWALLIVWIWFLFAIWIYKLVIYLFKKFKIIEIIDKLTMASDESEKGKSDEKSEEVKPRRKKISDKIKINEITAKAISYYIFLVFFRFSIVVIGIKEVEDFMWELLAYLPSLFIAVVIWFFWVRFWNFIYDIVYHALDLTRQKTAKIIASWAKIIILFFTLMVVLDKIWIATEITNTILFWFVSMLAIAWWLAFWLWWKDIAHEILESFRK